MNPQALAIKPLAYDNCECSGCQNCHHQLQNGATKVQSLAYNADDPLGTMRCTWCGKNSRGREAICITCGDTKEAVEYRYCGKCRGNLRWAQRQTKLKSLRGAQWNVRERRPWRLYVGDSKLLHCEVARDILWQSRLLGTAFAKALIAI